MDRKDLRGSSYYLVDVEQMLFARCAESCLVGTGVESVEEGRLSQDEAYQFGCHPAGYAGGNPQESGGLYLRCQ